MSKAGTAFEGHLFEAIIPALDGHVFTIRLNRPHRKNAINGVMVNELIHAFDFAKANDVVRVVVIAAEGDVFCAGGDLKALGGEAEEATVSSVPSSGEVDDMVLRLFHLDKPAIAKIQGPVLAGALLIVCNCTHAIAADHAPFSAPEIHRGLWPFQVMAGLFGVMPQRAALDFIMRGRRMSAEEAARLGLINEAVSADMLDSRVSALAEELAALPPEAVRRGLAALRAQQAMPFDEALPFLKKAFFELVGSEASQERIAQFTSEPKPLQ